MGIEKHPKLVVYYSGFSWVTVTMESLMLWTVDAHYIIGTRLYGPVFVIYNTIPCYIPYIPYIPHYTWTEIC